MANIIFRHYKEGDERQVANLFNISFQKGGGTVRTPRSWYWRYVKSPRFEPKMFQIAEDNETNKIVGAIAINLIEMRPFGQKEYLVGDINDVCTHPDYSKRGIATKLMENSIEFMKEQGCDFSILTTGKKNFARDKLYKKYGYFDIEMGCTFIHIPNVFQLIRNIYGLAILFPVFFVISYLSRFLNRIKTRIDPLFKDFSYEIWYNKKHFEYMDAANKLIPLYYEGFPKYDKVKFTWARIKVPAKRQNPTYILIKKGEDIIGGAVLTHQNIYAFKYGIKIRLGVIHEIFLDKKIFQNSKNLDFGYIYLIDKILKAATRRWVGTLIYKSTLRDNAINKAFKHMNFLMFKDDVIMIKELKSNLKFPQTMKPLFISTALNLGVP